DHEFEVVYSGREPITITWRKDGVVIPGETTRYLSIDNATESDEGTYQVTLANDYDTKSSSATLTVNPLPTIVISQQPSGGTYNEGQDATIEIVATGPGTLSYSWTKNESPYGGPGSG